MRSFILQLSLLLALTCLRFCHADTKHLASCPQDDNEEGEFINNGKECVRESIIREREVVDAECPIDYEFNSGKCRKHLHPTTKKPKCPDGFQRQGDKCYRKCPSLSWRQKYKECVLPRKTLAPKYMTCPAGQHRYNAYCCQPGQDCPAIKCELGSNVPGEFFYSDGICKRTGHAIKMQSTKRPCQDGQIQVWGVCQDPCPEHYRPTKDKCELFSCKFDATTDKVVECPEGSYLAGRSIF